VLVATFKPGRTRSVSPPMQHHATHATSTMLHVLHKGTCLDYVPLHSCSNELLEDSSSKCNTVTTEGTYYRFILVFFAEEMRVHVMQLGDQPTRVQLDNVLVTIRALLLKLTPNSINIIWIRQSRKLHIFLHASMQFCHESTSAFFS
jgi:hypothetical protein